MSRLEKKWQDFKARNESVVDTADDTAKNVGTALGLVAEELKSGYARIKKLIK